MDGYLGIIEQRLDKMKKQLELHQAVLEPQLAAKAAADAEAKKAADEQAKFEAQAKASAA